MKYKTNQVRNTNDLLETLNYKNYKKKKTNNAYLMSQNHHQILENDRLPKGREREREMVQKKTNTK